jgi:hypothetical protein
VLADDEVDQFLGTSTEQQMFATGNEPIVASSGDREFDYALAQTLSRITDVFHWARSEAVRLVGSRSPPNRTGGFR